MDSLHRDSVFSGHHVYKEIWTSFVGIVLRVEQEPLNKQELALCRRHSEKLYIVHHVPRKVSHLIWHFIESVNSEVTGKRKRLYKRSLSGMPVNAIPLYILQFY